MPIGDLYLSFIDILLVLPLFWAVYRGFMTGFIVEALALAVFLAGLYAYIRVTEIPGVFSENVKQALEYLPVAMFSVAAIIAFLFGNLAETYTHRSLRELQKGPIDRAFGAFFSVIRYLVLLSSIVIFMIKLDYKYQFLGSRERNKAVLYYRVSQLAPAIFPSLKFRHLENRYIHLVKDGRINLENVNDERILELQGGAMENNFINMDLAMEQLAASERTFDWNVAHTAGEGNTDRTKIYVELEITDTKYALQKTAFFRFAIEKNTRGSDNVVQLMDYKVNNKAKSINDGYYALITGKF